MPVLVPCGFNSYDFSSWLLIYLSCRSEGVLEKGKWIGFNARFFFTTLPLGSTCSIGGSGSSSVSYPYGLLLLWAIYSMKRNCLSGRLINWGNLGTLTWIDTLMVVLMWFVCYNGVRSMVDFYKRYGIFFSISSCFACKWNISCWGFFQFCFRD